MLRKRLGKDILFLDGAMGTMLQREGLLPGEPPEMWNLTHSGVIQRIHAAYFAAGSDIALTNTFGANRIKFRGEDEALKDVVTRAVENVRIAAKETGKAEGDYFVALDVGPTGKLLKPMGDLSFEEAYEAFREEIRYGAEAGADLICIETMSDTYEAKAAVLAAKETTDLPVFVTLVFDEKGKLLTGADVASAVAMLEGIRVDAIGLNCGMGPDGMLPILQEMRRYTSLPVIVKPNAGLPRPGDGELCYDISPAEFAQAVKKIVEGGACVVGGCCGTTPDHIRAMADACRGLAVRPSAAKSATVVSSYGKAVVLGERPVIIGERINPTGKSRLKQALKEHDLDYILREAIAQEEKGAHILDVNAGLPDIDEAAVMRDVITELQSVTSLPLQIDTVNEKALDAAMRVYNGKPMVNSVSGKQESMDAVFPLVKKYGGVVVGLTLDENGIPQTVEGRVRIAGRILAEAATYGIMTKDVVIDVLTMAVSSDPDSAKVTLEALRAVRERYGVKTVLGVSNISFGLPDRPAINANFYTMALQSGLSAGIINPLSGEMMRAYDAYCALMGWDKNFADYIARRRDLEPKADKASAGSVMDLRSVIIKGLKEEAFLAAREQAKEKEPLAVIQDELIPALDVVGKGFEEGTVFLPQLLMSADAAKNAFAALKEQMAFDGHRQEKRGTVILATVKGDVHDIGKNIVKVLLENYGFDVLDLGKDVPPETVVSAVLKKNVKLVGLSALMTTTVASMRDTIALLRKEAPDCRVMVGGAVLNQEYADMIGADFYSKDAMQSVHYAQEFFKREAR